MTEFLDLTTQLINKSTISVKQKTLTSYTGKANHVANLIFAWRPFLDALWAAVAKSATAKRQGRAQKHCIWVKQISASAK